MFSSMNALSNQSGAAKPPAGSPEIEKANSTEEPSNEKNNNEKTSKENSTSKAADKPAKSDKNSEQHFSASRQLSASSELQSGNNYTGVKLDISQNMDMGVHDKTAQMVMETNVRLSIESRFEDIPAQEQSESSGENKYTPQETANRLMDFAQRFMDGFLEQADGENTEENMQKFVDEIASAAEEGFGEAQKELGGSLSGGLEKLFNQVHDMFMAELEKLNKPENSDEKDEENSAVANRMAAQNDSESAEEAAQAVQDSPANAEENLLQDIIAENNKIAAGSEQIPPAISEKLQG
ncbi:MAG: DUF5610 domain-containing protein [bacterium]